jgi:hypothetical protein
MEPYRTDRPKVYADMPNSLTALLGRLADAGIPLTHTLYEYAMNPDAPVTETAQNLTDEFVPFKYQIRSGEATPSSLTKEALLIAAMPGPKKRGKFTVDEAATKRVNDWIESTYNTEPSNTPRSFELFNLIENKGKPLNFSHREKLGNDIFRGDSEVKSVYDDLSNTFPNEYERMIIEEPAYYKPDGTEYSYPVNRISSKSTVDNQFMPMVKQDGRLYIYPNRNGQQGGIQYTLGEFNKLRSNYETKYAPYIDKAKSIRDNPNLTQEQKLGLIRQLNDAMEAERLIDDLE